MTTNGRPNIVNVSWGDHLVFGDGEGRLETVDALRRRAEVWRDELDAGVMHWRQERTRKDGRSQTAPGYRTARKKRDRLEVDWDDFAVAPAVAREMGMKVHLYVPIFDEGRPLPSAAERAVSHHNPGHGRYRTWQSNFTIEHPEYVTVNRTGDVRQWGVLCLAYPEVRAYLVERFMRLMDGYDFDGLFLCLRSQSRPADHADEFGFNEPIRDEYMRRHGADILTEDFDVQAWRELQGEYMTEFLAELRAATRDAGRGLSIGCARGDIIGPPLGNAKLAWRDWVERDLIDDLVINQSSSQCPSLWIQLWPMHRGYGYAQSYLDGRGMPSLGDSLAEEYGPVLTDRDTQIYVARQWDERSATEEEALLSDPAVSGLAFSSFRHDNAELIAAHTGDWVAS